MTREEIREGVAEWVGLNEADEILQFLHSQGVVIKVDRELPEIITDAVNGSDCFGKREFTRLLKNHAGYSAFEPLIEDGHNDY